MWWPAETRRQTAERIGEEAGVVGIHRADLIDEVSGDGLDLLE